MSKTTDWLAYGRQNTLNTVQNEETRTKVTNTQCKTAFDALITAMRDMKKRYFYVPPLTEADLVGLGLKISDKIPTQCGAPTAEVTIETCQKPESFGLKFAA